MNDLSDLLRHDAVVTDVSVANKKQLLQHLAGVAAHIVALDPKLVGERLMARERLGSTGFGGGVAIPHAKIPGLETVVGVFARLAQPIDFDAIDDLPVDLVFLLLSPTEAGAEHLKALARVSRRLRDRDFLAKLRGAGSRDALYVLFTADAARDAAA
ncbi:PTS system nitrogen regulatory IIA component [Sphingomonas jinjuensis]|uniref:PTS system nitrogen regulatory IIA component n=1 Tax=Sphingomonas jinjuensis TaxID=535907 RepID=A0A840FEZ1_9SPHN|nr:PTS sugar transporter subunit IIA [Sphingomonas jinjuensis]MBB4152558.1 PTS system nitrogen regulatory IIA component [Sphingomonas jinjuensis]